MNNHEIKDTAVRDISIVVGIAVLLYISSNITPINVETLSSGEAVTSMLSYFGLSEKLTLVQTFFLSIKNMLAVFAMIFLAGIFWTTIKIREIHQHEHEKYSPVLVEEEVAKGLAVQWQVILEHLGSESPAEWKMAILEADNMLDEVLEDMGYVGETLAEKLKSMSRKKIASYDDVWEAHKVRNEIAHGGAIDMELSKKKAWDTVAKFGNTFKELGYL